MHIEKKDTLGISIAAGCQGGVFVCSVNEGSVAAKAGLKYGDQLLEVCTCICAPNVLLSLGIVLGYILGFHPQT